MPIYEYKAVDGVHWKLCRGRFEVRQGIDDAPLTRCPECGAEIRSDEPYVCEYCDRHICDRCIYNCGTTKDGWPVCNNHEPPDRPDEDWREDR